MGKLVKVRGVAIGEGMPKICVPLVGRTLDELKEEIVLARSTPANLVEWRVDYFEQIESIEKVKEALSVIRSELREFPLIFTFRSAREGGANKKVNTAYYEQLKKEMIRTGLIDIVDIELFMGEEKVTSLIQEAHAHGVYVICSNHDFEKTPAKDEILLRLRQAEKIGADIPKIAVMPHSPEDVLTLLEATWTMKKQYYDGPLITIAMGALGLISRMCGELFGSAVTFGTAKNASAPGQIEAAELKRVLNMLHRNFVHL